MKPFLPFLLLLLVAYSIFQCKNTDAPKSDPNTEILPDPSIRHDTAIGFLGCDRPTVKALSASENEYTYQHFVVTAVPFADAPGELIRVKNEQGVDFEVPRDNAPYFVGMRGDFLFVDRGTGPDRDLNVYDMRPRSLVFQASYTDTVVVMNNKVWIWSPVQDSLVTKKPPCPGEAEWQKNGLSSGYAQRALYDLNNKSITRKQEFKCVPMQ